MKLPVITNSQMRCYRRCAREHHYAYELGYRPLDRSESLRFGSLVHEGLEAWWKAHQGGHGADALGAAIEALRGTENEYELVRAGVMLQGYDARWSDDMQHYEVLGVETEFRAPLVNPETGGASRTFSLGGKLDAHVLDRRDGLVRLVEHKTSSEDVSPGSDYWKRLLLDPQVSTYFVGGAALGHEIYECIYDVLGKPGLRPAKATPEGKRKYTKHGQLYANQRAEDETPDEFRARLVEHVSENPDRFYRRDRVVRLEEEARDAAHDAWITARQIREGQLAERAPRNPDSCMRYGRWCSYFDVCTGTASLDDVTRFRRTDNVHEELTEAA